MTPTLLQGGKARRLSGAEIKALVAERMAELKIRREEEREAREADRNYSERLAFYGKPSKRVRFWRATVGIGAVLTAAGVTALLTTETQATLALILALGLGVTALVLSMEEGK